MWTWASKAWRCFEEWLLAFSLSFGGESILLISHRRIPARLSQKLAINTVMNIAQTPKPPYYAVIFTSLRTPGDAGYSAMSDAMAALAARQPGFLGIESVREELGITISYWESLEAIAAWKQNSAHLVAQQQGRGLWYQAFRVRICRVEREYDFDKV
jgi:heme-degrading monooxygenase HmoA